MVLSAPFFFSFLSATDVNFRTVCLYGDSASPLQFCLRLQSVQLREILKQDQYVDIQCYIFVSLL